MGIDYKAAVIVGLPRGDFEDDEQLDEWLDNEDLECCPPYYDGDSDDSAIVGMFIKVSGTYKPSELDYQQEKVESMKNEFKSLTGKEAKVWVSPYGF